MLLMLHLEIKGKVAYANVSKVHSDRVARKRVFRIPIPRRNLDAVEHLTLDAFVRFAAVEFDIVLRFHQKVSPPYVNVKIVDRSILNRPVFY